ncbi:type II toxin-antitoxin system PemK/MazF family toxin [Blastococcus capsensis]|uniref:type II toxin-antitoxin system PemK/MazF family toxin n=1 Tax=Blastococcus capsensis TaxID=1564163 RepID=UPI0025426710|nr:type II toxin-antitoxin system PemK/MazF family toxin [Blastococcus capsensis]MDK3257329.1 type II toxin-antitoxin system PemK/MazF family toxin [Blastococcus capsensis]
MAAPRRLGRTAARLAGRLRGALSRGRAALAASRPAPRPDTVDVSYRPHADDRPDPGEIVWAWVPFEEDDGRGKDRPVLVVGRRGEELAGLMLSSQDHDRDAADEARHGRRWTDIGSGAWDPRGRPSEVRLDRLLVLDPATVRREGAALDRARFERVVAEARRVQGW